MDDYMDAEFINPECDGKQGLLREMCKRFLNEYWHAYYAKHCLKVSDDNHEMSGSCT